MTIFVKNGGQYGGCWEWDTEVWREEVGMVTKGKHESICEIENVKCLACESDPWTRWWKCIALSTHMHTQVHMSTSKTAEIWIRLLECIMEKEMAPHSSVLAWRTPGTEEPGGLPSMGSHRVGRDWSDLAAAEYINVNILLVNSKTCYAKYSSEWNLKKYTRDLSALFPTTVCEFIANTIL